MLLSEIQRLISDLSCDSPSSAETLCAISLALSGSSLRVSTVSISLRETRPISLGAPWCGGASQVREPQLDWHHFTEDVEAYLGQTVRFVDVLNSSSLGSEVAITDDDLLANSNEVIFGPLRRTLRRPCCCVFVFCLRRRKP